MEDSITSDNRIREQVKKNYRSWYYIFKRALLIDRIRK